jgi:GPH family glycoside/pentoside/hexuronide:cation symporter
MNSNHKRDRILYLSLGDKVAYALPAIPLAVIGIPVYVFLPKFYTDTFGLSITTVGVLLMAVRLFDALTDPLIGYLSDRTKGRFGRRKPYMAAGSVGLAVSIVFLFSPPELSSELMAVYFGFWLFILFLFWTIITIPYESLGPELTPDYHERTSLFAFRDGFIIIGTLLAAASPMLADTVLETMGRVSGEKGRFSLMAAGFAPMIVLFTIYSIARTRERYTDKASHGLSNGFATVFRNRPFVILITAYTISALGSNLPATLILYYVQYVLQTGNAERFLLIYFMTGILFIPLWTLISKKIGKKRAWIISMAINTGAFSGVFFLGPGDALAYGILVFLSGIGFGAGLMLPSSIQADVIDYDQMLTGRRREGRYIGLWSIAKKLSAALGVGIGLVLMGQTGYSPNIVQDESTVMMLKVLYALVPCICNILSMVIISFYPIGEEMHIRIKKRISLSEE